jgi:hypothetical protein
MSKPLARPTPQARPINKMLDMSKWISLELTAEQYGFTIDDIPCGPERVPNKRAQRAPSGKGRER